MKDRYEQVRDAAPGMTDEQYLDMAVDCLEFLMRKGYTLTGAIDEVECHRMFAGHLPRDFRQQMNVKYGA